MIKNIDWDKLWIGLILGLLLPSVAFMIYYLIKFSYMTVDRFINYLILGDTYTAIISLCVLSNLAVFYPFIWKQKWKAARGVLGATFIWALLIVILKFS